MRLIDADRIEHFIQEQAKKYGWFTNEFSCEYIIGLIENAPTVEAEPIRYGRWKIIDQDVTGCKKYRCELCGAVIEAYSLNKIKYCGGCGAKMDEEVEK